MSDPETDGAATPFRVFLADDHLSYRRALSQAIDRQPDMVVVGEAADGPSTVEEVQRLRPDHLDLVLMDVDMPGQDGVAATRALILGDPDLCIVMLTVSTREQDLFESLRAGAMGYLGKGLSPDAIVRALRAFHRDEVLPLSGSLARRMLAHFNSAPPRRAKAPHQEKVDLQETLSDREREVLEQIARGARDRDVAVALEITEGTVKKHVQNILKKLHARNRTEAVAHLHGYL